MFRYDKDNLFKEFDIAKQKDFELMKNDKEVYTNRIQFCKDHVELKKQHPEYYELLDIKFDNLLLMYQSPSPDDYFYKKYFNMTKAEYYAKKRKSESDSDDEEEKSIN